MTSDDQAPTGSQVSPSEASRSQISESGTDRSGAGIEWDDHAAWWQTEFTDGADPEYEEQILPLIEERLAAWVEPGARFLDVGCGEGQISRLAAARGLEATGIDPSITQLRVAAARGGRCRYALGSAEAIPLGDAAVDVAVACLVFEHIPEPQRAIEEIVRVLVPGGRFLFLLNHPLLQTPDSGWIEDYTVDPPLAYWQIGAYLTPAETLEQVERGVFIRFFHRPLSTYINAALAAGLRLTEMLEPAPPAGFLARADGYQHGAAIPRLLSLAFEKA